MKFKTVSEETVGENVMYEEKESRAGGAQTSLDIELGFCIKTNDLSPFLAFNKF